MMIGALLTPCNVYSGLKIGWSFNMSVAAGLIGYAIWTLAQRVHGTSSWGLLENNINQTSASAAASIVSAGLAAPIPALTLLTGQTLTYSALSIWLLTISLLGVVVAAGLRNQLLLREKLPFPSGIVTAETMSEIHAGGPEARARLRLLSTAAAISALLKFAVTKFAISPIAPAIKTTIASPSGGFINVSAKNLGFALDPSFLMVGFGAIAGLRIGVSLLLGAIVGWGLLALLALQNGWAQPGPVSADAVWFAPLVEWLLWPGATLMVTASLTGFAISASKAARRKRDIRESDLETTGPSINRRTLAIAFCVVLVVSVIAQATFFAIGLFEAIVAVLLTSVLAIVAARVSGETAITPIGALGKITQLSFAAISPGNVSTNLMTANVTGGAAGQCADLMHDLKTGYILGATPSFQVLAQMFGILTGAFVAALTYIVMIPDPAAQLITAEWPAPAVATWKAVAEVLSQGFDAMPAGASAAIVIATVIGIALAVFNAFAPERYAPYIPSAAAMGLGFVIPAWNAISMFAGAVAAAALIKLFGEPVQKRIVVVAAGLIVGESLTGVGAALWGILA